MSTELQWASGQWGAPYEKAPELADFPGWPRHKQIFEQKRELIRPSLIVMSGLSKRNLFFYSIFFAIALGITSCIYTAYVKVTGSTSQVVTFTLFKSSADEEPSKFKVLDVTVQERSIDGSQWTTIWDLHGEGASLSGINYGMKYDGLNEIVPAKPLNPGRGYQVIISGTTRLSPGLGKAGASFFIDNDGHVFQK